MQGVKTSVLEKASMSAAQAAKILGIAPQAVRERIKLGIWDFGEVIPKKKTGRKKDSYCVYVDKLYAHIGKERPAADHEKEV